ncbi:MAG: hypothetical protein A2176_09195 [Spirochaetes bacterium RBG_13_51_14]|nr:MAG: hypothetical protein A2176_09195 [Spirochaetes bacterium RBG_13_51_14]
MTSITRRIGIVSIMLLIVTGFAAIALRPDRGVLFADDASLAADTGGNKNKPDDSKNDPSGGQKSEEEMFGDEETVTPEEKIKDDSLPEEMEKKSLTFSGFLNSRSSGSYKRGSILRQIGILDGTDFLSYFQSNFGLDARLPKGIRGYFNISADYYPAGMPVSRTYQVPLQYLGIPAYFTKVDLMAAEKINAVFSINEVFLDINFDKRVYFRIGKQVLKWGVGYLWTPTDLISIEKKNIQDSSQVMQGTYGLKIHVPFGTRANIYSFIDLNSARHLSDISMANKVEVLLKNTEMALSILVKKNNVPVYGFDFTSRIAGIDVHGEASLSYGDNRRRLRGYPWYLAAGTSPVPIEFLYLAPSDTSIMDRRVRGEWVPKASFGFGRGFEVKDVKDRIRFDVEVFYNHAGYDSYVFEKDFYNIGYFLSAGLYTPNYYGKYYAGAFITIRQMFVEELSAMINCIVNIGDQSSIVSGIISYAPYYDLTLNLMVNGFIGKENREYTVYGNYVVAELSAKLVF